MPSAAAGAAGSSSYSASQAQLGSAAGGPYSRPPRCLLTLLPGLARLPACSACRLPRSWSWHLERKLSASSAPTSGVCCLPAARQPVQPPPTPSCSVFCCLRRGWLCQCLAILAPAAVCPVLTSLPLLCALPCPSSLGRCVCPLSSPRRFLHITSECPEGDHKQASQLHACPRKPASRAASQPRGHKQGRCSSAGATVQRRLLLV